MFFIYPKMMSFPLELILFVIGGWITGWFFGLMIKLFIIDRSHPDSSPWQFAQKSGFYFSGFCLVIWLINFLG